MARPAGRDQQKFSAFQEQHLNTAILRTYFGRDYNPRARILG
jgi:hypothetical protein